MDEIPWTERAKWEDVVNALIGTYVVSTTQHTMTLSSGVRLEFETYASDCCTAASLESLNTTPGLITHAEFGDNEDETGGEGPYKAWIHVITEAGELNIAEVDGDAGNGYYIHGFALAVRIVHAPPVEPVSDDELDAALRSIQEGL